MTVRQVQGQAIDTAGHPIVGALVECSLNVDAAATTSDQVLPVLQQTTADSEGNYTLNLESNTSLEPVGTTYIIKIISGEITSRYQISVSDNTYPIGQTWFDVADLVVAIPPIPGPFIGGPPGPEGPGVRVMVSGGSELPQEPILNIIGGASVLVTAADNTSQSRIDVTVALSAEVEGQVTGLLTDLSTLTTNIATAAAAIAAESVRATTAEALEAAKMSPTFTGTVTLPQIHMVDSETGMLTLSGPQQQYANMPYTPGADGTSNPFWDFYGSSGVLGIGIDSADSVPYRDLMIYKRPAQRTVTDATVTNGSATLGSATAAFVSGDIGRPVRAKGIPMQTSIIAIISGSQATMSAPAKCSGGTLTGLYLDIGTTMSGAYDFVALQGNGEHCPVVTVGGFAPDYTYAMNVIGPPQFIAIDDTAMGALRVINGYNSVADAVHVQNWNGVLLFKVDHLGNFTIESTGTTYPLTVANASGPLFQVDQFGDISAVGAIGSTSTYPGQPQFSMHAMSGAPTVGTTYGVGLDNANALLLNGKAATGGVYTMADGVKKNILDDGLGNLIVAGVAKFTAAPGTIGTTRFLAGGSGADGAAIALEYTGSGYQHWVSSCHAAGAAPGNRIKLWTSDGTAGGAFPANAVLGLTVENGAITVPKGGGFWAHAAPASQPTAIASPTSDTVGTKAAIDAIRAALSGCGLTA